MSFIWLTDVQNGGRVAVNTKNVSVVFTAPDGEIKGKTIVSMTNGTLAVEEDDLTVVTMINEANA